MKRLKRRLLAIVLAIALVVGMCPMMPAMEVEAGDADTVKAQILARANAYEGWTRQTFINNGYSDIASAWCVWFMRRLIADVGMEGFFGTSNNTAGLFNFMASQGHPCYITDKANTSADWPSGSNIQYVTTGSFTPQEGDIMLVRDVNVTKNTSSYSHSSHVMYVYDVNSTYAYIVDGNGPTGAVRASSTAKTYNYKNGYNAWTNSSGDSMQTQIVAYVRPNYGNTSVTPTVTLPAAMTSTTSTQAKTNIVNYALNLVGYNRTTFTNAGCSDIPSGDWNTWFLKLCGKQVGINNLFSSSTSVSGFCTDMIKNYGAQAYYYTDSTFLTSADKTALSGAQAVTKSTFTPQKGDIYILHESGFTDMSQVGLVADVVSGSVYAVVGNNGTAQEVQYRNSTTNYFYQLTNAKCPIIGVIRPNYASLDGHTCTGTLVAAKAATCTTAGNTAYYTCSCGKWYSNSACTQQITDKNSVVIAAKGHSWQAATCTTAKTCKTCKTTSGSALGHNWQAATCTTPKTCKTCKTTSGSAKGHNWQAATCTTPKTCKNCKEKTGSYLGHKYPETPTYVDHTSHSYTCMRNCGKVKTESHTDSSYTKVCDICHGSTVDPAKAGLQVTLQEPNAEYVYTGNAIKPAIVVTQDGEVLTVGVDYTVKYTNNVNASLNKTEKSKPRVTVTGKGNLTGSSYTTFDIQPKDIAEADILTGDLIVETNTKASPVLTYNSRKLTAKDYTVENAQKKYTENGTVKITGKGNFKGTRTIAVTVVQKEELRKFTVSLGPEKLIYNGKEQKQSFSVLDAKTKTTLKENTDYVVVYPSNTTNAGTVRFSVIGIGKYTGTVTKSYTIKPMVVKSGMSFSGINPEGYPYVAKGAKVGGDLTVTYNNGTSTITLTEGKDYRISYSNNKKVSTAKSPAKFTVSFMGNYRGSTALKGTFMVYASGLSDATPGLKIAVADKTYTGKPGIYKSVPFVTINGVALKSSDYTVKYYKDAALTQEIKGKLNNIVLQDDEASATVYVKITGKGNYAPKAGADSYATASYKVCSKANLVDLSKARITFVDASGKKLTKVEYTGRALRPTVKVEVKVGKQYVEVPSDQYRVIYVNNVKKGKATAIVTGTGKQYVGSKSAKFTITSKNIKNVSDLWKNLFK